MKPHDDRIIIQGLEVKSRIGVPPEERQDFQRLTVSVILEPMRTLNSLADDLRNTIDYFAVAEAIKELCSRGERRLVETLADEICTMILDRFAVCSVSLEVRKYILADTEYVSVQLRRPL